MSKLFTPTGILATAGRGRLIRWLPIGFAVVMAAIFASQPAMAQMPPMNMPPMAQNDYGMTMEDEPTVIKILSNDYGMSAHLNPSSVVIVSYPLNGWIVVSPTTGNVLYTPDPEFSGTYCFEYTVSDRNGRVSNVASVMIAVMENMLPPVITSFAANWVQGNVWEFSGTVSDFELQGNLVTFGGLISGSTTTAPDGTFTFSAMVPPGAKGYVTAQATNDEDISSTVDDVLVVNN